MSEWLNNLAAGDTVIVNSRMGNLSLDKVARITKTQVILTKMQGKFRKSNGYLIGTDVWNFINLEEPDEDKIVAIRKDSLCSQIKSLLLVNLDSLPLIDLLRIVDILKGSK